MSKTKLAAGLIVGAIAGMVAGFLTAPKTGKVMRTNLKKRAEELKLSRKINSSR